ncbi:probable G-protein coupled receptor No9 [Nematostella vectensis]|uniref:probable G-protein coupled receptor No9 n=1 Tax=Nematostella vectensis TaxID=45351 RepID=UPI00138FCA0D|nr:probable G-protein coupled receptor No9 [Nematostella vectensis]
MNTTNRTQMGSFCSGETFCQGCGAPLAALYIITGILCMIGNGLVLAAIYHTPHLHRISNYFMASLAAADLSVGLLVSPLWAAKSLIAAYNNEHPLTIISAYMTMQTATTTTFNLCAVSIDRYVAITKPFEYNRIISLSRCRGIIAFIWVASFVLPIPRPLVTDPAVLPAVWMTGSTVVIILPLVVIFYCYYHIVRIARQQAKRIGQAHRETNRVAVTRRGNTKAAWTVAIIIGVFLLTWSPSLVLSTRLSAVKDPCQRDRLTKVWFWTVLLAFSSSAINPLIYTARSYEYRRAFRGILGLTETTPLGENDMSMSWATRKANSQSFTEIIP